MTWSEIKKAVEKLGISDQDELYRIECDSLGGSKTFHRVVIGKLVKLTETQSESEKRNATGCAV